MIDSPLFGSVFRQNAYRALLLPSPGHFKRTPFWLQRLRSKDLLSIAKSFPDFPIVLETYRDALEDFMDMPGLERVLDGVQAGEIDMKFVDSDVPSPVARSLEFDFKGFWMYQWDTPKAERGLQTLNIDLESLAQLFRNPEAAGLLKPEAIDDVSAIVARSSSGMKARTATELAQMIVEVGDMTDAEIAERCEDDWRDWVDKLTAQGRIESMPFEVDGDVEARWVAKEFVDEYQTAMNSPNDYSSARRVIARYLARSGPVSAIVIETRYPIDRLVLHDVLDELMSDARAAKGFFTDAGEEEWLDLSTLARIQERTLAILRSEVEPSDPLEYQGALLRHHIIKDSDGGSARNRYDMICDALELLQGAPVAAELWTKDVLPSRIDGFSVSALGEVLKDGDFRWVFCQEDDRARASIGVCEIGRGASRFAVGYAVGDRGRVARVDGFVVECLRIDIEGRRDRFRDDHPRVFRSIVARTCHRGQGTRVARIGHGEFLVGRHVVSKSVEGVRNGSRHYYESIFSRFWTFSKSPSGSAGFQSTTVAERRHIGGWRTVVAHVSTGVSGACDVRRSTCAETSGVAAASTWRCDEEELGLGPSRLGLAFDLFCVEPDGASRQGASRLFRERTTGGSVCGH